MNNILRMMHYNDAEFGNTIQLLSSCVFISFIPIMLDETKVMKARTNEWWVKRDLDDKICLCLNLSFIM